MSEWSRLERKISSKLRNKGITETDVANFCLVAPDPKDVSTLKEYAKVARMAQALHKELYHEYLKSEEWQAKRQAVLERDNHTCRVCKEREADHVHHMTYDRKFNEPLYDLVSVCKRCHKMIHNLD